MIIYVQYFKMNISDHKRPNNNWKKNRGRPRKIRKLPSFHASFPTQYVWIYYNISESDKSIMARMYYTSGYRLDIIYLNFPQYSTIQINCFIEQLIHMSGLELLATLSIS